MEEALQSWLLAFFRSGAFLTVLPLFSGSGIPAQVRVALAALLGLLIAPGVHTSPLAGTHLSGLIGLCAQEVFSGVALGFIGRMAFYSADFAGRLIANELGLSLASMFDPLTQATNQAPGVIMFWMTLLLMLSLDLHHWLLAAFQQSYEVLPAGAAWINAATVDNVTRHTARVLAVGLRMAAPMIAVSFIIVLVFAMLGRAVPQMNVFSESLAVRILGGLSVFSFTLGIVAEHLANYLRRIPEDLLRLGQLMAGHS
ncbi:MAG: flagellar biosynthetic protein FliR [Verrucomicrobia bacterium]|jgi:flagellar biosynthetic protein FliR|nr:flagellar biosynthetic protein FliR [Verrucomicrobiota bacterium]